MPSAVEDLYDERDGDVVLRVHVQPGGGRTAVVGRHGDALKVKVAAPPRGGRANEACLGLLADELGVPRDRVELIGGAGSRAKRVRLEGLEAGDLARALERLLADAGAEPGRAPTGRRARTGRRR